MRGAHFVDVFLGNLRLHKPHQRHCFFREGAVLLYETAELEDNVEIDDRERYRGISRSVLDLYCRSWTKMMIIQVPVYG